MDQLKAKVAALTPQMAFIVNAAFAGLVWLFYLILPVKHFSIFGYGASLNGIQLFDGNFLCVLMSLVMILGPIALAVLPIIMKQVNWIFVVSLAGTYFLLLLITPGGFGFGAILSILLFFVPWFFFTFLRGNAPVGFVK